MWNAGCYDSILLPPAASEVMAMNSDWQLRDSVLFFKFGSTEIPVGGYKNEEFRHEDEAFLEERRWTNSCGIRSYVVAHYRCLLDCCDQHRQERQHHVHQRCKPTWYVKLIPARAGPNKVLESWWSIYPTRHRALKAKILKNRRSIYLWKVDSLVSF
jgi:hypothetical protein